MHQHRENINEMQRVTGSWPTKSLKRPDESKLSPPVYPVNGLKGANLTAMSHITFPEKQLHLFTLPKMYATSHERPINRRTSLCSERQRKRMSPLLRMKASLLQPTVTAEQGAPRYRLSILLLLLAVKSLHI